MLLYYIILENSRVMRFSIEYNFTKLALVRIDFDKKSKIWTVDKQTTDVRQNKRPMGHIAHMRHMWAKLWFNHTRMICAKFGWNWPSGSWEYNAVLLFCYHLPLEKGVIIDLNKLKSLHPRTLCAEFGLNFLNFVKYFSLLSYKVWLISVGWYGEEDENVNSKHTDGRTEGQLTLSFRSGELKNHMSFQLMQSSMQLQK